MTPKQRDALLEYAAQPGRTEPELMIIDLPEEEGIYPERTSINDSFIVCVITPDGQILQQGKVLLRGQEVDVEPLIQVYADNRKRMREAAIQSLMEARS